MTVVMHDQIDREIAYDPTLTANGVMHGFLKVPMDYSDPGSPLISIAVSRREASNKSDVLGTIVLIDGGPGGDGGLGTGLPERMAELPVLQERFHLVGVDLRGRGRSTLLTTAAVDDPLPVTTRPDPRSYVAMAEEMRRREDLCAEHGGTFREHVTTRNAARDIESIRRALQVEQISLIGWAYGAYLAGVYGTMFGDHLHRVVFDSPPHPDLTWQDRFEAQVNTIRGNVEDWIDWASAVTTIPGWTSSAAFRSSLHALEARIQTSDPSGALITAFDLQVGTLSSEERCWHKLLQLVSSLAESSAAGDMNGVSQLLKGNASWRPSDVNRRQKEAVLEAITTETPWNRDPESYYARMRWVTENVPYGFGVMRVQPWVGTFRTASPTEPIQPIEGSRYGRGLVIHAQRDTLAPAENGTVMAEATGSGQIKVLGSGIHGIFGFHDIPGLTSAVLLYLQSGTAPECAELDLRVDEPRTGES